MSDESTVLVRTEGRIGRITLNRPKAINAITHEMVLEIDAALRKWADDDAVEAVLLDGTGERGLCAGGDIIAIHRDATLSATLDDAIASPTGKFWYDEYILNAYISHYPKPYIALMDGIVMGGGVGVSAHGNTRIVTDRTKMAMPEVGIGFAPDVGGTYLLAEAPGEIGTYLALTAAQINGADAVAIGFADHYLPAEKIDDFTSALITRPVAEVIAEFCIEPPASGLLAKQRWIDDAFAADTAVEIVERLRGHDESDAHDTANVVASKSPTSVEVTVRSLREITSETTLETVLETEYRVSIHFLVHHDLAEGIRAQVIDKDRSPKWSPPSLTAVVKADVDAFFAPVPKALVLTNGVQA
ncbi:UNVERIFIED_CONTAM: enoyl-CoA hydratase [Williamsia faeni]